MHTSNQMITDHGMHMQTQGSAWAHPWSTTTATTFTSQKQGTGATRVSDTVNFKHQYITNPTVSPEALVITAAQQLTSALKGNIPGGNDTMLGLTKVSKLFAKIALAKMITATSKTQQTANHPEHSPNRAPADTTHPKGGHDGTKGV